MMSLILCAELDAHSWVGVTLLLALLIELGPVSPERFVGDWTLAKPQTPDIDLAPAARLQLHRMSFRRSSIRDCALRRLGSAAASHGSS